MNRIYIFLTALLISFSFSACDLSKDQQQNDQQPTVSTVLDDLKGDVQTFSIDASRDTTLFGEEGTRIFFPAKAFTTADGKKVEGPVTISLEEAYDPSTWIGNGLSTTSGGKMLESGGMINLRATANGQELKLAKGKKAVLHFPKNDNQKDMQMFTGNRREDGSIDWKRDNTSLLKAKFSGSTWSGLSHNVKSRSDYTYLTIDNYRKLFKPYSDYKASQKALEGLKDGDITVSFVMNNETRKPKSIKVKGTRNKQMIRELKGIGKKLDFDVIYDKPEFRIAGNTMSYTFHCDYKPRHWESNREYARSFEQKYEGVKDLKNVDQAELKYYIFSSSSLGWINCDRFPENAGKRVEFMVENVDEGTELNLLFDEYNSMMHPVRTETGFSFQNIPVGQKAKVIAVKVLDGQPYLAIQEVETSEEPVKDLKFEQVSMQTLKERITTIRQVAS